MDFMCLLCFLGVLLGVSTPLPRLNINLCLFIKFIYTLIIITVKITGGTKMSNSPCYWLVFFGTPITNRNLSTMHTLPSSYLPYERVLYSFLYSSIHNTIKPLISQTQVCCVLFVYICLASQKKRKINNFSSRKIGSQPFSYMKRKGIINNEHNKNHLQNH